MAVALAALVAAATAARAAPSYDLSYEVRLVPTTKTAEVRIRVAQTAGELIRLRMKIDPERHRAFTADGKVSVSGDTVEWKVPSSGGSLRYDFLIDHLRNSGSYDARCAADWAIFRGDDLVPPIRATTEGMARSNARLRIRAPEGWSVVTRYKPGRSRIELKEPGRRFVRPTGWIVAARRMGVLREKVAGTWVAVAGPASQGLRRLDILALLRWTLPDLAKVLGTPPERLLVVGAGDPMWRGGLSGPSSLFIHADRPLITPDTTSPILHEVLHAALRLRPAPEDDWIVEGLAEYYSLELLVRSRTISRSRHDEALEELAERGTSSGSLSTDSASGAVTARAITLFRGLDREIRERSEGERSLDDVVRALLAQPSRKVSRQVLRREAARVAGHDVDSVFERHPL
jgi:hypothetical protein